MIRISTEIGSASKIIGEEKAVEEVAKAGFDAWDFSMMRCVSVDRKNNLVIENDHPFCKSNYLQFARHLRKIGEDNGIICNQYHAPFPVYIGNMVDYIKRAIECSAEAGVKICVVHPTNSTNAEKNSEMFFELLEFAKDFGIKIATENMWDWDIEKNESCFATCATPKSFIEHIDIMKNENFVACLDIGHAEMRSNNTSAEEMILNLNSRLQALHIHDNDLWHDTHQIPFSMNIDFDKIIKALKK